MLKKIELLQESLAVIGSRDYIAKKVLAEIYILLSQHFPVDTMHIPLYQEKAGTLTYKAFIINRKVMLLDEVIQLSDDAVKVADEVVKQRVFVINNSNQLVPVKEIANHFMVKATVSLLFAITQTGPESYSGLTLAAYGENRYLPEHADLIIDLSDTLAETVARVLARIKKDRCSSKAVSSILEVRNSLEHQRIDLVLNSQTGLNTVVNQVQQVGPVESPVLIVGETGVGKELIARLLHGLSHRADKPFIAVNCGALPESLLDSELFGFEKGAFTGAAHKRAGYFEQADKGTLFLDEVGELPLAAQTKLLRVLQHQTFQRVGGSKPVSTDARVIAATHRNIQDMIKEKKFREDLWYRLNVFPIEVPPLRDRKSDIPILVQYLINSKLYEMNLAFEPQLSSEALEQLVEYDWPGNVRELQNVLERALILSKGAALSFPNLVPQGAENTCADSAAFFKGSKFLSMDEMMAKHICHSLKLSKGKIAGPGGAAELLKMNPSTLRARMKKFDIRIDRTPCNRLLLANGPVERKE
jgi:transcriptional regulator with GAF, ATPase, and Fis domain